MAGGAMSRLKAFVRNYDDKSDDDGFQFVFYCDRCGSGYISQYKKYSLAKVHKALSFAGRLLGGVLDTGASAVEQVRDYRWHEEHDKAFFEAMEEAKAHFHQCPSCRKYVCGNCWNDEVGLCIDCAPRLTVEAAKIQTRAKVEAIEKVVEKKAEAGEYLGEARLATETLITCPNCGKLTRPGRFCEMCGSPLAKKTCPKCGAEVSPNARFCSNCGARLL